MKKHYWTSPNGNKGWKVHAEGNQRASGVFETKKEATKYGRDLAIKNKTEHIVQNMNGKIGYRNSYGNDPYPPRG